MTTLDSATRDELIADGKLITRNKSEENNHLPCYEATTSSDFFDIASNEVKKVVISDDDYFVLRPNNQVVCVTKESFDIPLDLIARVILKGHYFALGIASVSTYMDPGFKGRLGVVLTNTSKNYIKIFPNKTLAKVEFSKLAKKNKAGYIGQHGANVDVWPFRKEYIATSEELEGKGIVIDSTEELERIYGIKLTANIVRVEKLTLEGVRILGEIKRTNVRINVTWRWFVFFASINAILPLLVFWLIWQNGSAESPIVASLLSVLTGLISNGIFLFIQYRFEQKAT